MTPDEAIAIVHSKANGRTRYEGQEPYLDEVLVSEIERLRKALSEIDGLTRMTGGLSGPHAEDLEIINILASSDPDGETQ